jgi:hypothetical protein
MTTFKTEIVKSEQKQDGTYNVKIRVTHKRKVRRYSTPMYATDKDVTRGGKIKNQIILDKCEDTIREWRKRINLLGTAADSMDVTEIMSLLTGPGQDEGIPMWPWMDAYAAKIPKENTRQNYTRAIKHLKAYIGMDITFQQLKARTIRNYIESYTMEKTATNLMHIHKMYKEAMKQYNDDDITRIPSDPFALIDLKVPKSSADRSVPADVIRRIYLMPDNHNNTSGTNTANLARDMFCLSFMLMGTNMADLYEIAPMRDGAIRYERRKTRDMRLDRAAIEMDVHPLAQKIIKRYAGKKLLLNLSDKYSTVRTAARSIQNGLKIIRNYLVQSYAKEMPGLSTAEIVRKYRIDKLVYYSARHSWATIARNDLNIDKWTVHEGLNHVDNATKITDIYIKKDFARINEANKKVIEYVFGGIEP